AAASQTGIASANAVCAVMRNGCAMAETLYDRKQQSTCHTSAAGWHKYQANSIDLHVQPPGLSSVDASASRFLDTLNRRPVQSEMSMMFRSTTILAVRHRDHAVLAGDGQVTFGQTVVKQRARKIRRLYNDRILAGFAGSAADSFALFARFESKLEQFRGNLERSAVELAKDWRSDRILRRL